MKVHMSEPRVWTDVVRDSTGMKSSAWSSRSSRAPTSCSEPNQQSERVLSPPGREQKKREALQAAVCCQRLALEAAPRARVSARVSAMNGTQAEHS